MNTWRGGGGCVFISGRLVYSSRTLNSTDESSNPLRGQFGISPVLAGSEGSGPNAESEQGVWPGGSARTPDNTYEGLIQVRIKIWDFDPRCLRNSADKARVSAPSSGPFCGYGGRRKVNLTCFWRIACRRLEHWTSSYRQYRRYRAFLGLRRFLGRFC